MVELRSKYPPACAGTIVVKAHLYFDVFWVAELNVSSHSKFLLAAYRPLPSLTYTRVCLPPATTVPSSLIPASPTNPACAMTLGFCTTTPFDVASSRLLFVPSVSCTLILVPDPVNCIRTKSHTNGWLY